jgi:hypothetical protein
MPYNLSTLCRLLYFPSKGSRATNIYRLKIHHPRLGLKPRTLGAMASTIKARPPRATRDELVVVHVSRNVWIETV